MPISGLDLDVVHEAAKVFNAFVLQERESRGRRIKMRISFEVWSRRRSGNLDYARLREQHVVLSCPNSAQARAVVALLQSVCKQLDGKFLAE
jgi:hypothetical protein